MTKLLTKLIEKYNLEKDIIQVEQFILDSEVHLYLMLVI